MGRRLGVFLACLLPTCTPAPPPVYRTLRSETPVRRLGVVGDLQRTGALEILIGRESNDPVRRRVLRELAACEPDGVLLLGDLVFCGASSGDWWTLDRLLALTGLARLPLLPVVGNHETWGPDGPALRALRARFPLLSERTWYARRLPPLGLICLDSNVEQLGAAAWGAQARFYAATLARFDRDPAVRAVVVACHHPPFTNHPYRPPQEAVRRTFLPPFFAARKTVAFLSGHTHAYEHFLEGGRHFLVLGTGGGPRVRLLRGAQARFPDRFRGGPLRPFGFLLLAVGPEGLTFTVRGLASPEAPVQVLESFQVLWP